MLDETLWHMNSHGHKSTQMYTYIHILSFVPVADIVTRKKYKTTSKYKVNANRNRNNTRTKTCSNLNRWYTCKQIDVTYELALQISLLLISKYGKQAQHIHTYTQITIHADKNKCFLFLVCVCVWNCDVHNVLYAVYIPRCMTYSIHKCSSIQN